MESVPKDLELLVKQIAAAAEVMNPRLRVTWLPDAAGEQYVFMLSRDGGAGEIRIGWKTLRGASPDTIRSVLTSKLPSSRQIFRGSIEGAGNDLKLHWKEDIA
jgi:hypothetical protein